MAKESTGVTSSIYFKSDKEVRRVRQAAKVAGLRPNALMRQAVLAEAERVIAKGKKAAVKKAA